jgi:hypothetical protein
MVSWKELAQLHGVSVKTLRRRIQIYLPLMPKHNKKRHFFTTEQVKFINSVLGNPELNNNPKIDPNRDKTGTIR